MVRVRPPKYVLTEEAAHEIVNQLKALITGNPSASFLAAHPPLSVYETTDPANPASRYGGAWRELPSTGAHLWVRTDDGSGDGGAVEQFLASHPPGCVYRTTSTTSPASEYGGTWEKAPSLGANAWIRKG